MAVFDDLPNELLIDIVRRAETWNYISQTSRRLRAIAEPLLYHFVDIGSGRQCFKAFVRTIISRPSLGYHVRYFILSDEDHWTGTFVEVEEEDDDDGASVGNSEEEEEEEEEEEDDDDDGEASVGDSEEEEDEEDENDGTSAGDPEEDVAHDWDGASVEDSDDSDDDDDYDDWEWLCACLKSSTQKEGRPLSPWAMRSIIRDADPRDDESGLTALIIVLLHHLPRIDTLGFHGCYVLPRFVVRAAFGSSPGGVPAGLLSVRCVDMIAEDVVYSAPDVLPFIRLPNVEALRVNWFDAQSDVLNVEAKGGGADHETTFGPDAEVQRILSGTLRYTSPVIHMSFQSSAILGAVLKRILLMPQALESFRYSTGRRQLDVFALHPSEFGEALQAQKHSIQTLFLVNHWHPSDARYAGSETLLGSFHDFSALTSLALSLKNFVGSPPLSFPSPAHLGVPLIDLLPSGLIYLAIGLDHNWTLENFASYINLGWRWSKLRDERLPMLKTFNVSCGSPFTQLQWEEYNDADINVTTDSLEDAMEPLIWSKKPRWAHS